MDSREAALLKDIDPSELGNRIRAARVAKGLTQGQLAGSGISVGYVSRIESGQRRPIATVLEDLSSRLEIPVDHLLRGVSAREYDEIKLTLDFAELSLESGEHVEAEAQARKALDRARAASQLDMEFRARYLIARSLEGQGLLDDAILELEPLVDSPEPSLLRLQSAMAISRCHRESGDFTSAIEAGEKVLAGLADSPLDTSDEAVQLAVMVAAAYFERGDHGQAVRMCRKAVAKAELLESPKARASAYWNASVMESERGSVGYAVSLAERALALLSQSNSGPNVALLRTQLGTMQLQLDPPPLAEVQANLDQAAEELAWSRASAISIARNNLVRARVHFLSGDLLRAAEMCADVHPVAKAESPILAAEAKSLEGQTRISMGDVDQAKSCFREAVFLLTGVGADRKAAQLWFDLASLLEEVGDFEGSRQAYRSAAASSGLRAGVSSRLATEALSPTTA